MLAPVDKASMFAGKAAAMAVELLVVEAFLLSMVAVLFELPLGRGLAVIAVALALGTVGLAAIGGLFGVLAVVPRAREAALPLLVLPLATPLLVAGVKATELAAAGLVVAVLAVRRWRVREPAAAPLGERPAERPAERPSDADRAPLERALARFDEEAP